MPEAVLPFYREAFAAGQYTDFDAAGRCELALLRSRCVGQTPFAAVRGVSEGLEHRLERAVRASTTHEELLEKQGKYYELWSLQQGIFRDKKRGEKPAPVSAAKVVEDEEDGESITY